MNQTKIEWTERTWNPVTGCTKVSSGCDHCYAETIATRFAGGKAFPRGFAVTLHPERLDQPLRWRKPATVFVNSMSDLFHADVPDEYIAKVFAVMALTPQHTYQILTKRPGRMRSLLNSERFRVAAAMETAIGYSEAPRNLFTWPLPNVWLGVSVESQKWADVRIPALLDTPAAVRFLSCEPLLGPVTIHEYRDRPADPTIDWVIIGGESGHNARPMHPQWARRLRDQCAAAIVPFFFKQWGAWAPVGEGEIAKETDLHIRRDGYAWPITEPHGAKDGTEVVMRRVGKSAAGRELDGREWNEMPQRNEVCPR
ncbi:DUF5131 family protein [Actinopolymorpha alba]|uniref:DUF5131 family protein n=1 Tax=Actinopolymorpha alba TaxID=533267 RepID=UPI00037AE9BB|nr:phage Gp37/Gp68 family protein [Actinopolymorpha alba]